MNKEQPKILICDIETTPLITYAWGRFEQNALEVKQESYILSMAYKWLNGGRTQVLSLDKFRGYKPNSNDDKKLICTIHDLFDEADIIIAQNGDEFDIKKINTRFIYHGLTPTSPYKTVDTLKIARRYFAFSSNSLNELGKYLGLGEKKETHGFKTWLGCMKGEKKSWNIMKTYNIRDVTLLEKVYKKLAPWIKSYPKVVDPKTPTKELECNSCGKQCTKSGVRRLIDCTYTRLYCPNCGHWQRGPNIVEKKVRK